MSTTSFQVALWIELLAAGLGGLQGALAPGREIAALDLVADGPGLVAPPPDPVLDAAGRAAFRKRLDQLSPL